MVFPDAQGPLRMELFLASLHSVAVELGAEELEVAMQPVDTDGVGALEEHLLGVLQPLGVGREPHRIEEPGDEGRDLH